MLNPICIWYVYSICIGILNPICICILNQINSAIYNYSSVLIVEGKNLFAKPSFQHALQNQHLCRKRLYLRHSLSQLGAVLKWGHHCWQGGGEGQNTLKNDDVICKQPLIYSYLYHVYFTVLPFRFTFLFLFTFLILGWHSHIYISGWPRGQWSLCLPSVRRKNCPQCFTQVRIRYLSNGYKN